MSSTFQYPNMPLMNPPASPIDFSGDSANEPYLGIYAKEATQRYMLGTRYLTWDGRVFRYGYAGEAMSSAHGCTTGDYQAMAQWAEFGQTHEIGSNPITCITETTYDGIAFDGVFAEDVLAGGFIALWPTGAEALNYGIIGNDALAAAGTLTVYLDHPLRYKITADAGSCEAIFSPYRNLQTGGEAGTGRHPVMGVPMSDAAIADYFWLQTWGPIHLSTSDSAVGANSVNFDLVWGNNGIPMANDSTADQLLQHCGFTLAQDYNDGSPAQGAPFLMLQISP